jgi:DNA-binding PadR family transcriptional regulator
MGEVAARTRRASSMQSAVGWGVLGLVIERPSYAYELAVRFERTYEGLLALSSVSHVYTTLGTLQSREMIEQIPSANAGRQPKPYYRATAKGCAEYRNWFVSQIGEDLRRKRLFVLQLGSLARTPGFALDVLDRCEQVCQAEALGYSGTQSEADMVDAKSRLKTRLLAEDDRLTLEAKLAWTEFAREQIHGSPNGRPRGHSGLAGHSPPGEPASALA